MIVFHDIKPYTQNLTERQQGSLLTDAAAASSASVALPHTQYP